MSFYFYFETNHEPSNEHLLSMLGREHIDFIEDDENTATFFQPGQSLRGATVYQNETGYEIGVNAFTTSFDATLTVELSKCLAQLCGCKVQPEDCEEGINPEELHEWCGPEWYQDRTREGRSLLFGEVSAANPQDNVLSVRGYRRWFGISRQLFETRKAEGMNDEEAIKSVMDDAIALQEIETYQDIFVPAQYTVTPPKSGLLKRLTSFAYKRVDRQTFTFVSIPKNTRTLVEAIGTPGPIFAMIKDEDRGVVRVPISRIHEIARQLGAREICCETFDLTLPDEIYSELASEGEPLSSLT